MSYAAEKAETALVNLLDDQTTPDMATYLREFLRTRQITRHHENNTVSEINARTIAIQLLRCKKIPQLDQPNEADLTLALQAYQDAPAPSVEELEARYQRLMSRAKYPNHLSDLRYDGPSNADGYRRLADGLTRQLKLGMHPYNADEIEAIALVCEHYTNLRLRENPWQPAHNAGSNSPSIKRHTDQYRKESDLDYAKRRLLEAKGRVSQLYAKVLRRDPRTGDEVPQVKPAYNADQMFFEMVPGMPVGTDFEELAAFMFAPYKMNSAVADIRIPSLAEALREYQSAFQQLQAAQEKSIDNDIQKLMEEKAVHVATASYRRCIGSMHDLLIRHGFSRSAASRAMTVFALRATIPDSQLPQEFQHAVTQAAQRFNEPEPKLPEAQTSDWISDIATLRPYLSSRTLSYPNQPLTRSDATPMPIISGQTIAHLAKVGLAEPQFDITD